MPSDLRFSAILLTYPQSSFDINGFIEWFCSGFDPQYICVCSETHQDGSLHRHAVVSWKNRQHASTSSFDYEGRHPNLQIIKGGITTSHGKRSIAYVQKCGDFMERGSLSSLWKRVITCTSRKEAEQLIIEEAPREYVTRFSTIQAFLMSKPSVGLSGCCRRRGDFCEPPVLEQWVSQHLV
nr:MAG: hypothetical protein [Owegonang virus 16]